MERFHLAEVCMACVRHRDYSAEDMSPRLALNHLAIKLYFRSGQSKVVVLAENGRGHQRTPARKSAVTAIFRRTQLSLYDILFICGI
jgi:hypothetical protein